MSAASTILVADDDAPVRRVVAGTLQAPGRRFLGARDGEQALALAARHSPDLVILDLQMPKLDGWEVLRGLRLGTRTRMTPVVILSSAAAVVDKVGGLDQGADDFVTKPFDPKELRARVESLLRRHWRSLEANPLSGLPGNHAIEEEVERRIGQERPFALFHIDVDGFKAFNDAHGFAAGDRVLLATAELVRRAAGDGFAGHIGGDDFAMVTDLDAAPRAARRLAALFDERASEFGDSGRGGPLTLSIGATSSARRAFACYRRAAEAASRMKGYLKSLPPARLSRFAFDRREGA